VSEDTSPARPSAAEPPRPAPSGAQLNADELGAWRGFLRVHARITRALDAELVAHHALSLNSYEVLLTLDNAPDGRLRMADLVDSVLLSRNRLTRLVDRLEQGGLMRPDAAELADSVQLSRSGLARLVDRLERDGYVRRESTGSDLPGFYAALTESGRTALLEARETHLSGVRRRFLSYLSVEEQRAMASHFDRMLDGLEEEEAAG
jgi:DNA-binding MarR family transcriptional regulator